MLDYRIRACRVSVSYTHLFFKSVVNGEKDLTLELEDGTVIKLPKRQVFSITLDKTRFSLSLIHI